MLERRPGRGGGIREEEGHCRQGAALQRPGRWEHGALAWRGWQRKVRGVLGKAGTPEVTTLKC